MVTDGAFLRIHNNDLDVKKKTCET
jgi:hypothetical protein